jgi:hypothetical protein
MKLFTRQPARAVQAKPMPSIQPDSDGKFWFELMVAGRPSLGVKLEQGSPAARFVLGERSQEGLLALRERVAMTSRHFAEYIRADLRLEPRDEYILAYA